MFKKTTNTTSWWDAPMSRKDYAVLCGVCYVAAIGVAAWELSLIIDYTEVAKMAISKVRSNIDKLITKAEPAFKAKVRDADESITWFNNLNVRESEEVEMFKE